MKKMFPAGLAALVMLATASCSFKYQQIDRHTIMEDEAAGEWPEFEKDVLDKSKEMAPTAFPKTDTNAKQKRLYNVLNGELVSEKR